MEDTGPRTQSLFGVDSQLPGDSDSEGAAGLVPSGSPLRLCTLGSAVPPVSSPGQGRGARRPRSLHTGQRATEPCSQGSVWSILPTKVISLCDKCSLQRLQP